ncbi:MAG: hypothetical protein AB7K09_17170 [Planctomycetota bacterium]
MTRWTAVLALMLIASTAAPAAAQELTFGANVAADRDVVPAGGTREVIASFKLTAAKAAISVNSMTVEMTGSGNDDGVTVHVLIDANDNGLADDDERSAGALNAQRDDDAVVLDTTGNLALGADETVTILIAYDFNQLAPAGGDTFSCSITDATNDVRAGNGGLPLVSARLTIDDGGPKSLTFDANTAADRDIENGETAAIPSAWHVAASSGHTLDLTTLVIEAQGTGNHIADIVRVMLVEDEDNDGQFDPGGFAGAGEPILAEGTFADQGGGLIGITFDDRGNSLIRIGDKGVNLIVVVEFTSSLTNGDTFGARAISAATDVDATIIGLPTVSAVLTVNNPPEPPVTELTVTSSNPSDSEVEPGATDVLVGMFDVFSNGGLGEVTGITFDAIGDARDDLDILVVRLIRDANKSGVPDAGDELLGELTFSADNGSITYDLSGSPMNITDGTSVRLLAVVDVNTSVPDGLIFGMTFSSMTTAELTTITGLPGNTSAITIMAAPAGGGGGTGGGGGGVGTGSGGCAMQTTAINSGGDGWLLIMLALALALVLIRSRRS